MGADASRLDGDKTVFRYGPHPLMLWAAQRVDALFEEDGQFYESEIQGFEDGKIRVLFVEYGNEQLCELEDLRPMVAYQMGEELEAKYAVDEQWYPASVVDFDEEFKEYTVQFHESKEEQICDRSFLRPLPDVVDQIVQEEIARQVAEGLHGDKNSRARSKTNVQKRLEAKEKEMQERERAAAALVAKQDEEDEFGDLGAKAGPRMSTFKKRPPPPKKSVPSKTVMTVADALESSEDEDVNAEAVADEVEEEEKPVPAKKPVNPIAAAAVALVAAKKAVVNPIAAAAAAAIAKKQEASKKQDAPKTAVPAKAPVKLFSSDEGEDEKRTNELMEAGDDPFADPFVRKPLFSDVEDDDDDDLDDEDVAAEFLANKKKGEDEKKRLEAEEQAKLRAQMYSKIEEDIEWLSGEECEAVWAEDGQWYKAMVIGAEADGIYTVEFTEYAQLQEGTSSSEMRRVGAGGPEEETPSDDEMAARGSEDSSAATTAKTSTSSSGEPSPLPQPKAPAAAPKVSVPALKLAKGGAKLPEKLMLSKIEQSDSDDDNRDDDEGRDELLADEDGRDDEVPVAKLAPAPAAAAAIKKVPSFATAFKKTLPPVTANNDQKKKEGEAKRLAAGKAAEEEAAASAAQAASEKVEKAAAAKAAAAEKAAVARKAVAEKQAAEKAAVAERIAASKKAAADKAAAAEKAAAEATVAERAAVEEAARREEEERLRRESAATLDAEDKDFAEMQELLEPTIEHHDIEGPPMDELEGLFEDDEFLDFLPEDGSTLGPGDDTPDEGDASQLFGIFDTDDMGLDSGLVGGPKDTFLRFSLNRDGLDAAEVVSDFEAFRSAAGLEPMGTEIDPRVVRKGLRAAVEKEMDFKSPKLGIFKLLDKQSKRSDVLACGDTLATSLRALVVGAGIGGLRVACELALLGVRVVVVEKRSAFTRNNVLHLWSHVVADVQALGAAFWVPGFCKGNIHHCPIRKLQLCLLRSALLLGVDVFLGVQFEGVERKRGQWSSKCNNVVIADYNFNVLIGSDGEASKVASYVGFDKKETAYSLALGITANFENSKTKSQLTTAEVNVARHFKQEWFAKLAREKNIELENMVYYKDDTHYFVCTAMKDSLISKGVLRQDIPDLVSPANVNKQVLQTWCEEVAAYAGLPKSASLVPVVRADGSVHPDTAIFDFSRKFRAVVPVRVFASSAEGGRDNLLWAFVIGDALMEPFWPLGTGANRAVLSAWDAAATLVQVGMLGLTTAEASESKLAGIFEGALSMYNSLQATEPNTMKPEKFKMPGEPAPLYSYDPNSRYQRMKVCQCPEGEGMVLDWEQFIPNSSVIINTMSKGSEEKTKKRLSNPFKPKPSASAPALKGPSAFGKRTASTPIPPKKVPAPMVKAPAPIPAPVVVAPLPDSSEDLSRLSVAPPSFAAPAPKVAAPNAIKAPPPSASSPVAAAAAAVPKAVPVPKKVAAVPSPVISKKPVPSASAPSLSSSGTDVNKSPKAAIAALAANDPSFEILDMSGNTTFVMKHREYAKELAQALKGNTVVKEVHLKQCDLDKVDVQELCEALAGHVSLQVLDLEKNKIDNEGAEIVANALRKNWSIRELNLLGQARAFGDACLQSFIDMFDFNITLTKIIWRLDSRKSFAINKLLVRNNTIQKNMSEQRDVTSLLPSNCNLPDTVARGSSSAVTASAPVVVEDDSNLAPAEEDDDDYCATVDLNVAIKPKPKAVVDLPATTKAKVAPPATKPKAALSKAAVVAATMSSGLDDFEDDLYDEVAAPPVKTVAAKTIVSPRPSPVPAVSVAPSVAVSGGDDDDDDYIDTVDLNAIVPAKAPAKPAPLLGRLAPTATAGGRLRAMSGRGKAPNPAALLATKLPPRKATASPAPTPSPAAMARKASTPPALARPAPTPTPVVLAPVPVAVPVTASVPAPPNAPADVVPVYEALSALNDRFAALSEQDDLAAIGPELIAELARIRDEMLPLHTKYKAAGCVVGAVAKWRNLNTAIPKLVNAAKK